MPVRPPEQAGADGGAERASLTLDGRSAFRYGATTRLCTDDAGQNPAQRSLAAELVDPVLLPPEDEPPHQELLEDLPALRDLAPEETSPVREAYLHLSLNVLKVTGAEGPESF